MNDEICLQCGGRIEYLRRVVFGATMQFPRCENRDDHNSHTLIRARMDMLAMAHERMQRDRPSYAAWEAKRRERKGVEARPVGQPVGQGGAWP